MSNQQDMSLAKKSPLQESIDFLVSLTPWNENQLQDQRKFKSGGMFVENKSIPSEEPLEPWQQG